MAETYKGILGLIFFHLLLFRKFYFINPYVYARGECLEQCFSCSIQLGRHLRNYGLFSLKPVNDPYYYPDHSALPFLSTYYFPHRIQAWIGSFLNLNQAFILFSLTMVVHFLFSSLSAYILLTNMGMSQSMTILGSLTLSSMGYAMKHNSCIVYTLAWIPTFILACSTHLWVILGISLGMIVTGGYWPIAIYTVPLGCYLYFFPIR